jgi:hypothetical protein
MTALHHVEKFSVTSSSRTIKMTSVVSLVDWLRLVVTATVVMASLFGIGQYSRDFFSACSAPALQFHG